MRIQCEVCGREESVDEGCTNYTHQMVVPAFRKGLWQDGWYRMTFCDESKEVKDEWICPMCIWPYKVWRREHELEWSQ